MEKDAGLRRDIEVVLAVRKAAGPEMRIAVDPNNGYKGDREGVSPLLRKTAGANLYWVEEIFPETMADYTRLKDRLEGAGSKMLIEAGENVDQAGEFEPCLKPRRLMDVIQPDIRHFGFVDNLSAASRAESAGAISIPHNWGAQTGLFMALHLGKAVKNFPMAEDDRSTVDVLNPEGYEFGGGTYGVPGRPGLSIQIDESAYRMKRNPVETVITN